jgi:hypothetical protein
MRIRHKTRDSSRTISYQLSRSITRIAPCPTANWVLLEYIFLIQTLQKLKNLNNRHIKIVSCKMLKKIEWLLGQYRLIDPQDKTLVFTLLKIYALYLPNRLRMHHLLNEAKGLELTWQHEYELYQYNINYELSRTA